MRIRKKFKIKNLNGKEYDLMLVENLLYNLDGFGFDTTNEQQQFQNNFSLISSKLNQPEITGSILLSPPNVYKQYRELATFLYQYPLTIIYNPEGTEFMMKCYTEKIEKEELGNDYISVKCTFKGLERFGKEIEYINPQQQIENSNDSKTYSYKYSYKYAVSSESIAGARCNILSTLDCPCRLEIKGEVSNPVWRHYVNDELVESGRINYTVKENETLIISTLDNQLELKIYDSLSKDTKSVYELSDYDTERFIWLKNGDNRITVSSMDKKNIEFKIQVKEYYESV